MSVFLQDKMDIQQVKQKHELDLMKIEGVEGVGISEENGQEVIVLYTSKDPQQMSAIPQELEGYSIICKKTDPFKAY